MVRLEIGRLVGDQRVGGGVGLGEAVARELRHQLEDRRRPSGGRCPRSTQPPDEALALLLHLLGLLLAHRAAQQVGLAQAVARQPVRDLEHLVLVDDHAERLGGELLELGQQVLDLGHAVLAVDVVVDHARAERARPVERDDRDQLLEAAGPQLHHELRHAAATRPGTRPRSRPRRAGRRSWRRRGRSCSIEKSAPPLARIRASASAIVVRVLRPRKSNLISPTFSTQRMSNCVITSPDLGSR